MGLETAATIKDLVSTNPVSNDPRDQGDDHLRMLKVVLKAMFPGMVVPLFSTQLRSSLTTLGVNEIYTVQVADAVVTLNLPAYASAPAGYCFFVYAKSGAVTLDPNGAETINGVSTLVIVSGSWGFVMKGATAWECLTVPVAGLVSGDIGVTVQAYDADTAKLDVDQTWTGAQRGTLTTDNDGSFDQNVTNNFACTPTGAAALTFTNHTAGQTGLILFVNGSNYAITAAATTYIAAADLTKLSATGTYLIAYLDNGTNAYCTVTAALTSAGA
jgi:hypothetical protein